MKKSQRGFIVPLVALLVVLVAGGFLLSSKKSKAPKNDIQAVIDAKALVATSTVSSSTQASIKILSPDGGQLFRGQSHKIMWSDWYLYDVNKVAIYLIDGRTDDAIEITPSVSIRSSGIDGTSSFNWTVPTDIAPGDDFKIEIRELQVGVKGISEKSFSIVDEVPRIIQSITTYPETGDRKPVHDDHAIEQVKKDILAGKFSWFNDPVEVSNKYGTAFGIAPDAKYYLEVVPVVGEDSGLMHAAVLANTSEKSYRISLISEQSKPYMWLINGVSDISQSSKLKVNWFNATSTYETDGVGHAEIVSKFGDGTTLFYLNVKKPVVDFYLNQPALPSSINTDSIIVEIGGIRFGAFKAKATTEQVSSHGSTFSVYSIQVDLSDMPNLKSYSGQNVRITLTDKIKDALGNPLQQCDRSYNKGECISDSLGQKVKVFGAELKLYSI